MARTALTSAATWLGGAARRGQKSATAPPQACYGIMSPDIASAADPDRPTGPRPRRLRHPPLDDPERDRLLRLLAIPVFLVVAFSSTDGQDALAVVLFGVIGWADYLDGFAARLTGQYSRLGALLDPVIDRLLVISGMVVCWQFSLLPRWAIAVVIARELLMLVAESLRALARPGHPDQLGGAARRGPDAGAPFFAMAGVHWLALILLYVGMALWR